jgi:hypothetical protein
MKQTRSTLMLLALAIIVAIGLPYYLSSQKASALDGKTTALKSEAAALKLKSATGEKVRKATAEWTATQALLAAAMPANPDIQGAIRTLQGLTDDDAAPDRVRWVSASVSNLTAGTAASTVATTVKPGEAAPKTTAKPTTAAGGSTSPNGGFDININVEGSRAKILAFVTKIQQKPEILPRLFAVKSVTLTVEKAGPPLADGAAAPIQLATANLKLKVITFGIAPEKAAAAAAAAAAVIVKVPAGAATSAPSAVSTVPTTIAPKP